MKCKISLRNDLICLPTMDGGHRRVSTALAEMGLILPTSRENAFKFRSVAAKSLRRLPSLWWHVCGFLLTKVRPFCSWREESVKKNFLLPLEKLTLAAVSMNGKLAGGDASSSVTGETARPSEPHKECLSVPLGKQWQPSSYWVYTHLISMLPCSATPSLNLAAGDTWGGGGDGVTHHSCLSGALARFRNTYCSAFHERIACKNTV